MGHPVELELTNDVLLILLVNHYTKGGALLDSSWVLLKYDILPKLTWFKKRF